MKESFGDTLLGGCIGIAAIILAVTIGFGGCCHLADSHGNNSQQIERKSK